MNPAIRSGESRDGRVAAAKAGEFSNEPRSFSLGEDLDGCPGVDQLFSVVAEHAFASGFMKERRPSRLMVTTRGRRSRGARGVGGRRGRRVAEDRWPGGPGEGEYADSGAGG